MPSLNAMFKLYDGYSSTIDKVNRKTDQAANKILNASGATDKFNTKLSATGASAVSASSGLSRLVSVAVMAAAAIKSINFVDNYTNTASRLSLINDGLQTQAELQTKIFAAADRAKGSYSSMADAVAKLQLNAGDQFKSNDEAIAFTELLQKSFKISGASTAEKESGTLQLTQAMGAGKLQGDEFRSIMENAPMVADAIAKYTGKSKGELKEMSSEGEITADIIKNAMFAASDDINDKFAKMPYTFADIWNKIKNGGTQAFSELSEKINNLINTDDFQNSVDALIGGLTVIADVAGTAIDLIVNGLDTILPILAIISGVYLAVMITKLWAMIPPLLAQAAGWLTVYWPILVVIAAIGLAIVAARQLGASWEDIISVVGGIIGVFITYAYNEFVRLWNVVAAFINFFGNAFRNPLAAVRTLFYDLAVNAIGFIEQIAKGIETLINKIPGVQIDIVSKLTGIKDVIADESAKIKEENGFVEFVKTKDYMDYSEGYTIGSNFATDTYDTIADKLNGIAGLLDGSNAVTVEGTGSNGNVNVDMDDEDIQYLRDIAERDYINKFSTATLAPNVSISFGNVTKEADADQVAGRIRKILQEEIATAAEG